MRLDNAIIGIFVSVAHLQTCTHTCTLYLSFEALPFLSRLYNSWLRAGDPLGQRFSAPSRPAPCFPSPSTLFVPAAAAAAASTSPIHVLDYTTLGGNACRNPSFPLTGRVVRARKFITFTHSSTLSRAPYN